MAILPMRRNPLTSMLNFAAERDREAASLGSVISQIAKPVLGSMGVQTDEMTPQPAVMRGPVPTAQPLGPMTGPAPAPTPAMAMEELKANVFPGESGGDYNALFGYANRPGGKFEGVNLTDMTVDEVIEFTDPKGPYGQWVKGQIGRVATPTGAFQTVGTTLKDAVRGLGLTGDEPYNEATQDAIGMWIYENQGPEAWEGWNKGTMTAGGGDARLGGGAGADTLGTGGNVEDILAQLYPQMSPEEEKKQRRKDFFAAASQGLSALSQGRPQDFSNIRQMQEQRRTQAVQDMRERERARAGAAMILDQGGSPALATAFATGAASMSDYFTDRQIRQAQETADKQKLLAAQRAKLLVPSLEAAGIPEDRIAKIVAYGEEGGDVTELLTFEQTAAAADKAREVEAAQEELGQEFVNSDDPAMRMIGRLVQSGVAIKDAIDSTTKLFPQAGGTKEFANLVEAQAIVDSGEINPNTGKPFADVGEVRAADLFRPTAATAAQPMVRMNPDGTVTIIPAAPAAPVAAAAAPAAPAAGGAPAVGAPVGVSGAFSQQLGSVGTGIPPAPAAPAAPAFVPSGGVYAQGGGITATAPLAAGPAFSGQAIPLDVATQVTELAQKRLVLQQARDAAPDDAARRALDLQIGNVNLQAAQLQLQEAQAATGLDKIEQELRIATAEANLAKAEREIADAEEGEKAASAKKELRLTATTEAGTRQISKLLGMAADWNPGVAGGFERFIAGYLPGSEIYNAKSLVDSLNANSIITTIGVMKESSATGATGFGATTLPEISAMQDQLGKLDPLVEPELFIEQLQSLNNFILDSAYGTQSQIAENPNLTDAEKEFYSQRFDLRTGEIVSLGLVPLDEGVITMWQQGDTAANLVVTPDDMTAEERAIFDSLGD